MYIYIYICMCVCVFRYNTIQDSMENESKCQGPGSLEQVHAMGEFPAGPYETSDRCSFMDGVGLAGVTIAQGSVESQEECCKVCEQYKGCAASDYIHASPMRPTFQGKITGGTCHLKSAFIAKDYVTGEVQTAIRV